MKSFIYTYHEKVKTNGVERTVSIYRIYKNRPQWLGRLTGMFMSEFQLVMELLEIKKALPAVCFARNPKNNTPVYGSAWKLEQDGIATIERIT